MARRLLIRGGAGGPGDELDPTPAFREGSRGLQEGLGVQCPLQREHVAVLSPFPRPRGGPREAVHVSWVWCEGLRGSWPVAALAVGPALLSTSSGPPGGHAISRLVFGALRLCQNF